MLNEVKATTGVKTVLILITFLVIAVTGINSQVSEEWVKRYTSSGDNDDRANDMVTDAAGNIYVTGTVVGGIGGQNFYTVKYNPSGTVIWSRPFENGSGQNDLSLCVALDGSGNVYAGGMSILSDSTGYVYTAIKYNSAGTQQWVKHYTESGNVNLYDMAVDAAGNVYMAGINLSFPYSRIVTVKYNTSGTQQWVSVYNPVSQTYYEGSEIEVDGSGNVYIGGFYGNTSNGDILLIKYNSAGAQQWVRTYSGGGNIGVGDLVNDMVLDAAGNIYLAGQVKGQTGSGGPDMVTLKYNPSGTLQWAQKFNGTANYSDLGKCIGVDAAGNVYVAGSATATGSNLDIGLIKYNSAGTQQWVKYYNGAGNGTDAANDLILDAAGNILITGNSMGLGTGNNYITMRYNPSGTQIWLQTYLGPGNASDIANTIALGTNGVVYITGTSEGSGSGLDYATVKYAQTVGVQNVNSEIPERFSLEQNYPNPFNPVTNIGLRIADFGFVSLKVYDISGKEVAVLVNEEMNAGVYNVSFEAANLASGTYFYRLEVNGFSDVKKMIVVK
jgi:uncharacterized delta-60 repeat protein